MNRIFVITAMVLVLVASSTLAEPIATFVLRSGEKIEKSAFKLNNIYKTVELQVEGKKRVLSFSDIASISDEDGEDITYDLIGRKPRLVAGQEQPKQSSVSDTIATKPGTATAMQKPDSSLAAVSMVEPVAQEPAAPAISGLQSTERWEDANSESYKKKQRAPWGAVFHVGPAYTLPLGDYYRGLSGGLGVEVNAMIPINRSIGIGGWISYSKMGTDPFDLAEPGFTQVIRNDLTASQTSIALVAHYYGAWKDGRGKWDVFTGLGAVSNSMSGEAWLYNSSTQMVQSIGGQGETKFAMPLGLSFSRLYTKSLGIEFQTVFTTEFIGAAPDYYYDYVGVAPAQYAFLWGFRVGLIFAVSRGE